MTRTYQLLTLCASLCCIQQTAHCQSIGFTDKASDFGITYSFFNVPVYGMGVSLYDHNEDGFDDLSFGGLTGQTLHVYQSSGNDLIPVHQGEFANLDTTTTTCVLWVDYDNDGQLDMNAVNYGSGSRIYRRDQTDFTDVSALLGIQDTAIYAFAGAWGDIHNDGLLDLHIGNHNEVVSDISPNRLYRNALGQFYDITLSAGVYELSGLSFGVTFIDYNKDGAADIYVANDRHIDGNRLYRNSGNGEFIDVSDPECTGMSMDGMGVALADYDHNGYEDIYVTNTANFSTNFAGSLFCVNDYPNMVESANTLGVAVYKVSWGCSWADFDNDGDQDLFVANTAATTANIALKQNDLYLNQGDGTFIKDSLSSAVLDYSRSYGCAVGDLNNDGYPDIVVANVDGDPMNIWINDGGSNSWLKVTLEGTVSNRMGVGSWIEVYTGDDIQYRYTRCGTSYGSQDGRAAMFGLAQNTLIDSIVVRWPSGLTDVLMNIPVNQTIHIVENSLITGQIEHSALPKVVHPNPTTGIVRIQNLDSGSHITICDIYGRIVSSFSYGQISSDGTIDLQSLTPGQYLIRVQNMQDVRTTSVLLQ